MIRLVAIWLALLASTILLLMLREDRLVAEGKVPLGRLRRFWFKGERRRAPRYRVDWEVRYQRAEPPTSVRPEPVEGRTAHASRGQDDQRGEEAARTRDLSRTGMGLILRERVEVGSFLQLELIPPGESPPLPVIGQVTWTREVPSSDHPAEQGASAGERLFLIGIRFQPLDENLAASMSDALSGIRRLSAQEKAKVYSKAKRGLLLADLALTVSALAILLASGWARTLEGWITGRISLWPAQVAVYVGSIGLGMALVGLPLDWFGSFVLEHRFGLATQRFGQWLWDFLKRFCIGGILGLLVVEGLVALIRWRPQTWWGWAAFAWIGWSTLLTRLAPTLLIPIFYKQQPLKDSDLRQRLESFLERCKVRVRGIFELNLSRTTRKANAMLCGLGGTRRVLVSDTLLSTHTPEEIEVVLAHEIGHHRFHHLGLLIAVGAVGTAFSCFVVHRLAQDWLNPLGLKGLTDLAALPLIGLVFLGTGLVGMPVSNGISRWLERQADRFALETTGHPKAFISTMRQLAKQNLSETDPPRWVEWLLYDHPPIAKRIVMAQEYEKRG